MKRQERGFLDHTPNHEERQEQALEQCEAAFCDGLRRQLEGAVLVGTQLGRIREEALYLAAECQSFEAYCRKYLELSRDQVKRYLDMHDVVETIRSANLELPANEVQATMLTRVPREKLLDCWRALLGVCAREQVAMSNKMVRGMVEIASGQPGSPSENGAQKEACESRAGVKVTLDYEAA